MGQTRSTDASTAGPKAIEGPPKAEDGPAKCSHVLVMTNVKSHLTNDVIHWTRQEFPMSEISDKAKGNTISVISSGTKDWNIVWRKKHASDVQLVRWYNDINPDIAVTNFYKAVVELAENGHALTVIGSRAGTIVGVFQPKRDGEKFHTYVRQGSFDSAWIKESWAENRNVVALVYFEGSWVMHTASNRVAGTQAAVVKKTFPEADIRKYWDQGYVIQLVAASPSQWVVILAKLEKYLGQGYVCAAGDDFPSESMKIQWKDDRIVTAITGN